MRSLHLEKGEYDKLLDKDPRLIQEDIIRFISLMKGKQSSASIKAYVAGLKHFYDLNDIVLNWRKIRSFEPEPQKVIEDRPYSINEIRLMVDRASNLRNKSIILLMFSSGLRVGGLSTLRLRDLELIKEYGVYRINVYPRTRHNYFSFCTPECTNILTQYMDNRKQLLQGIKFV